MMEIRKEMRDRISDLPDHLLHHILSFLLTRDQVRTRILSKPWKTIWISSPVLEFYTNTPQWELRLMNFVEGTLGIRHRQMIPISKLVIHLPIFSRLELGSLLYQSISYALESNIKQLELLKARHGISYNDCHYYGLPDSVLNAKSLSVLTLGGFKFKSPPCSNYYDLPDSVLNATSLSVLTLIGFKLKSPPCSSNIKLSLKRLHLQHVCLNDQLVRSLLDRCPDLEDLSLKSCRGLTNLKISGLFKLKHLSLKLKHISFIRYRKRITKRVQYTQFETLEIEAFRLESFHYCGESILQHSFSCCKNVKILKLSCVKCKTENWLLDTLSNFPLLEVLRLKNCTLKSVRISCHLLKELCLKDCTNVFKIEIDTPNLHSFTYHGDLSVSFSSNALSLIEANIHLYSEDPSVEVAEFLGKFNHCKVLNFNKSLITPKEFRTTMLPPLYNIKHLTLRTGSCRDPLELVEGLLWTCPHPETLSIICYGKVKLSMKFLYENQVEKEETTCFCASLPIICWRHCLKELKIEKLEQIEYQRSVKNFFVENAKMLEKIEGLDDCNL